MAIATVKRNIKGTVLKAKKVPKKSIQSRETTQIAQKETLLKIKQSKDSDEESGQCPSFP